MKYDVPKLGPGGVAVECWVYPRYQQIFKMRQSLTFEVDVEFMAHAVASQPTISWRDIAGLEFRMEQAGKPLRIRTVRVVEDALDGDSAYVQ